VIDADNKTTPELALLMGRIFSCALDGFFGCSRQGGVKAGKELSGYPVPNFLVIQARYLPLRDGV